MHVCFLNCHSIVLLLQLSFLLTSCQAVTVQFTQQNFGTLNETEGSFVTLYLEKDGDFGDDLTLIIELEGETTDLRSNSWTVTFGNDDSSSQQYFSVFVAEDNIPEDDETIKFVIRPRPGITIGEPSFAFVTIPANDDAYGVIGFETISPIAADEMPDENTTVTLSLLRKRGRFGNVTVTFEISGIQDKESDIFPQQGTLTLLEGEYKTHFQVYIADDQTPENDELFEVTLTDSGGGLQINKSLSTASIVVKENDSPLRFSEKVYRVEENQRVLKVVLLRGLDKDGVSRVGPDGGLVWVTYEVTPGTATSGSDYNVQPSGTFSFSDGIHRSSIDVFLIDDDLPELNENFTIKLLPTIHGDAIIDEPMTCTVVIEANDNAEGVLMIDFKSTGQREEYFVIDEDKGDLFSNISVERRGGAFSKVSIQWVLVDNSTSDIIADVEPTSGILSFEPGQVKADVTLKVIKDDIPEEAKVLTFRLLPKSIQGGATLASPSEAALIIADSDDVYGVFDFSSARSRLDITDAERNLIVEVNRKGGVTGIVDVDYSVYYLPPGIDDSRNSMPGITSTSHGHIVFQQEDASKEVSIGIESDAFLETGSKFLIIIDEVNLLGKSLPVPPQTPLINVKNITVSVTEEFANGEIGFWRKTDTRANEPLDGEDPINVVLELYRQGLSGAATVQVSYRSSGDNVQDVVDGEDYLKGPPVVLLKPGERRRNITLKILPDEIPEVDEVILVRLDSVTPSNQKLKRSESEMRVIISENDSPGGVFSFSNQSLSHYLIQEQELEGINVKVVREKGDLATRLITYDVVPNGAEQFFGVPKTLVFPPGRRTANVALVPRDDNIPELDIDYTLVIFSEGRTPSVLTPPTTIQVTVLANDYPYGLFVFGNEVDTPRVQSIGESAANLNTTSYYRVHRTMGTYGNVSVSWKIVPDDTNDVIPTNGVLLFFQGETEKLISVNSRHDELPESLEEFSLHLLNATGGAEVKLGENATLIIEPNDKAISFKDPPTKNVEEGKDLILTIHRDGSGADATSVLYRTRALNANDSLEQNIATAFVDYLSVNAEEVKFEPGALDVEVVISTIDDDIPEDEEGFYVELLSNSKDYVAHGTTMIKVNILQNDDASGVFSFNMSRDVVMKEGVPFAFKVDRKKGAFGHVSLHWKVLHWSNLTYQEIQRHEEDDVKSKEFVQREGEISFEEGVTENNIFLEALMDFTPEYEELFTIALLNVTAGQGRLSSDFSDLVVRILVKANDHPYGLISFANTTSPVMIAEDGNQDLEVIVDVNREMGSDGSIQVMWELHPGNSTLPTSCKDLLLNAEFHGNIFYVQSRPYTKTQAVSFTSDSYGLIKNWNKYNSSPNLPALSFCFWIKFNSSLETIQAESNAFVMLSTSDTSLETTFSLGLEKRENEIQSVVISFRPNDEQRGTLQSVSLNLGVTDLSVWHHVVLTFSNDAVSMYADGTFVDTKSFNTLLVNDAVFREENLIVGPGFKQNMPANNYIMQDVRFYDVALTSEQIFELHTLSAHYDITPVNGYLTYSPRVLQANFTLSSVEDSETENNEDFRLVLMDASGGGDINQENRTLTVTVLKSDNANGLFGFYQQCEPDHVIEGQNASCFVSRSRGLDGKVVLEWIATFGHSEKEDYDFVQFQGEILFLPGEIEKTFVVSTKDDLIPEIVELHAITLKDATPLDGIVSSSPYSGASVNGSLSSTQVSIARSDKPNGVLQFSDASPPTAEDNGKILEENKPLVVHVTEENGHVTLMVVRAAGWFGDVSTEWRTEDGTAVSNQEPRDFESSAGTLTFEDGQGFALISVTLLDDDSSELEKHFFVELTNPTGGAGLNKASRVKIVIDPSDNAFGVFHFNHSTKQVNEPVVGTNTVTFKIIRSGGNLGDTIVEWRIRNNVTNDLSPTQGQLHFIEGQTDDVISIEVLADEIPEFDENFRVDLIEVSQGSLGSPKTFTLTVLANDDPRGVISFDPTSMTARESDRNVTLTIRRSEGLAGTIRVHYSTMDTYLNNSNGIAKSGQDFHQVVDSVLVGENVTTVNISVDLIDDDIPESDEIFFVELISTEIVSSGVKVPNSPRLGNERDILAEVSIVENDNPHGVLELSTSSVDVDEDSADLNSGNETLSEVSVSDDKNDFLFVVRKFGTFGDVTVSFHVIPGSASSNEDYNIASHKVTLLNGEFKKPVPIHIINDITPEIREDFRVELLPNSVSGGAKVGSEYSCTVVINESDDPYGLFEISVDKEGIEEPAWGKGTPVTFTVDRRNGKRNVVGLQWTVHVVSASTAAGSGTNSELNPPGSNRDVDNLNGLMYFTTGDESKNFTIKILPDDIPEDDELVVVRLDSILSGHEGRINPSKREVHVLIPANDRPYGDVMLQSDAYFTTEDEDGNNAVSVVAMRNGGLYGTVRVIYSTSEIDLVSEMLENQENLIEKYLPSRLVDEIDLAAVFHSVDILSSDDPLVTCAEACLRERVCHAFLYQKTSYACKWTKFESIEKEYITYTPNDVTLPPSELEKRYSIFEKNLTQTSILYNSQAKSGVDFVPRSGASVLLYPGQEAANITITILGDTEPELDEYFKVGILKIEMVDYNPLPSNFPKVLSPSVARVTIEENDHPYGMFALRSQVSSSIPTAPIEVEERPRLSVELMVERTGGSVGDVTVDWSVIGGTALRNSDFIGDDSTLKFSHGETLKVISLSVIDDAIPEASESINIQLSKPTNGAVINPHQDNATIIILANDIVGGVIGFTPESRSVIGQEGDSIILYLTRSDPALGRCEVIWHARGANGYDITDGLNVTEGVILLEAGQVSAEIYLEIKADDIPESKEQYTVVLDQVISSDITSTGSAILNPASSECEISIQDSDDPHGVFRFSPTSQRINIKEDEGELEIIVTRQFGAIGRVRVYYDVIPGTLSTVNPDIDVATPGSDFRYSSRDSYVTFEDGVTSVPIVIEIVDDDIPELIEIFHVNLTQVRFLEPNGFDVLPTEPPKIDASGALSQVVIDANDGTKGVVSFDESYANINTTENSTVTLRIIRDRGTYGEVTVFIFPQNNQAILDLDYSCQPTALTFADSQQSIFYNITILDDDIPEGGELFEVFLDNPSAGLELGNLTTAAITIQSNDDAHGRLSFEIGHDVFLDEPTSSNISSSTVELVVVRNPPLGVFGQVSVRFKVQQISSSGNVVDSHVDDLTPTEGYVTIEDGSSFGVIEISAVADDVPELEERYAVTLFEPSNGATLDYSGISTEIVITENDAPYGDFQVFPAGSRNATRDFRITEDNDKILMLDVVRKQGLLGFVTVDVQTVQGSATPLSASSQYPPILAPSQTFPQAVGTWFHAFQSNGLNYLVYLTSTLVSPLTTPVGSSGGLSSLAPGVYSTLYKWNGIYVPVQTIETDGASCATTFHVNGVQYLFITNRGADRRRKTVSRLYELTDTGMLRVVQDVQTKGASYVVHFNATNHYLVVSNSMDNNLVSSIDSVVLRFDSATRLFEEVQSIPTRGAEGLTIFTLNQDTYLAIANKFDSEIGENSPVPSVVYKWSPLSYTFTQPSTVDISHAADVQHFLFEDHCFLLFSSSAKGQKRVLNEDADVVKVYQVVQNDDKGNVLLRHHQLLSIPKPRRIELVTLPVEMFHSNGNIPSSFLKDGNVTLLMVSSDVSSRIFLFDSASLLFKPLFDVMSSTHIYPHLVNDSFHSVPLVAVATNNVASYKPTANNENIQLQGDYIGTKKTLTFEPGQTMLTIAMTTLDDNIPEKEEEFQVVLSNSKDNRAVINAATSSLNVIIEANDDAFGVIGFSEDSVEKFVKETSRDNSFTLNVVRNVATFGKVVVDWSAEGNINDITPVSGQIVFEEGQSVVGIQMAVLADDLPEIEEIVEIDLFNPRVVGSKRSSLKPRLNGTASSRVKILANDSPHGVVSWAPNSLQKVVNEVATLAGSKTLVTLDMIREQGAMGDIEVHFKTIRAENLPVRSQASPGVDFISRDASLVMKENSTRAAASFSILPDDVPEDKESFYVVIDDVNLIGKSKVGGKPGIETDGSEVAEVTIDENDNARGFIQFNVTRNEEGAVDAYELPRMNNSVKLPLERLVGLVHSVGVEWLARPVTTLNNDFFPSSGSVEFLDNGKSSEIEIFITDDEEVEFMESFTVQLIATTGGAQLGGDLTVTVNILPNDSPTGMFGFLERSQIVEESKSSHDPRGVVEYQVKRFQGSDEHVTLLWELETSAHADLSPISGKLEFDAGERSKSIILRTLPDNQLEGEEVYDLKLTSATGGAEISPIAGVAKVVIAANQGAAGILSLMTHVLYISEPSRRSDGVFSIDMKRGPSLFGRVTADWHITPADHSTFKHVHGKATIEDGGNKTFILIQTVDDDIPEHSQDFVLRLESASGGARLSSSESSCLLTMVASDSPHGVFTFLQPLYHVKEGLNQDADSFSSRFSKSTSTSSYASVQVLRNKGTMGEVAVKIETVSGSARPYVDFYPLEKRLIFGEGEAAKVIDVEIIDDDLPEGPKDFFVNITDIQLLSYNAKDLLSHLPLNLSRDTLPEYGEVTWSTVRIAKSDGAEGIVEFAAPEGKIEVLEENGEVDIALIRSEGDYGSISITINSLNQTAKRNVDFLLPSSGVTVQFEDGQKVAHVTVLLVDDSLMESEEKFTLAITAISGGAKIGEREFVEVTILKSDYPNGLIQFVGENNLITPNLANGRRVKFTLERFGGNQEAVTVTWRITRAEPFIHPTTSASPLNEDISTPTNGVFLFQDGQGGSRYIFVNLLPALAEQEVEEKFVITLEDCNPAEVSKEKGNATITILHKGHPNGVVKFGSSDNPEQSIQQQEIDEPTSGTTQLVFPITRFLGSLGQLNITWSLSGANQNVGANGDDVKTKTGFSLIYDGQLDSEILISVVADDLPELDEIFVLTLLSVEGGAEIDRRKSQQFFMIRANDNPHGIFSLSPENQRIIIGSDMSRFLRINITRDRGAFGRVEVGFSLQFDNLQPGVSYVGTDSGSASFDNATTWSVKDIEISPVFLAVGDSFTVKLSSVQFNGVGARIEPAISASHSTAKVVVTSEAANPRVGFENSVVHVRDVQNNLCTLTVTRDGLYGDVTMFWSSGYPPQLAPSDVEEGDLIPSSGEVTIKHQQKSVDFNLTLISSTSQYPGYALHIKRVQSALGEGGKVLSDHDLAEIDPCGAIRFSTISQLVLVNRNVREVNLTVERLYGIRYDVEVNFDVIPKSASPHSHYFPPPSTRLVLRSGENKGTITIRLVETAPEQSKYFLVNLTSAVQPDNIYKGLSPRIIADQSTSHVTISESPDARGVLSFTDVTMHTKESSDDGSKTVLLMIDVERTEGAIGDVSVIASTFEDETTWQGVSASERTIHRLVAQRVAGDATKRATGGEDYEIRQFNISFPEGTNRRSVSFVVLDDDVSEPAEAFFLYLHSPTGGAKVRAESGILKIVIDPNDTPNGVVGFLPKASSASSISSITMYYSAYYISEDSSSRKTDVKLLRTNAFGPVTISWRALTSLPSSSDVSSTPSSAASNPPEKQLDEDRNIINLEEQLQSSRGSVTCPAQQMECDVPLTLKDDAIAEFASTFYLEIYQVSEGAKINKNRRFANVTIRDSDYPFGLFQFSVSSRFPVITKDSNSVGLIIERVGGVDTQESVSYTTREIRRVSNIAGITLYPAKQDIEYIPKKEKITFKRGEREAYITIQLKPEAFSADPLPVTFQVVLDWSSGSSELSTTYHMANVTIVVNGNVKRVWRIYEALQQDLDETILQETLAQLHDLADGNLGEEEIKIFHGSIDRLLKEGRSKRLSDAVLDKTYQLFCKLLDPNRIDAVRGHSDFSELFDKFSLCFMTDTECVKSDATTAAMTSCKHAIIQSSRWYPELINGYVFNGAGKDFFKMPNDFLDVTSHGADSSDPRCYDVYFVEYSSSVWFHVEGKKDPMSNRIFSVGVDKKGVTSLSSPVRYRVYTSDARISPQGAECVLWRPASSRWQSASRGACHVIDDSANFVDCACNHMSVYAARGPTDNLASYNEATYAACFIAMIGFVITLLGHHMCAGRLKVATKLFMHMCFACAATQLVFVIATLASESASKDACSTLAIFLHYFWLAQFTWMLIQSVNILQVLSFSNERTDRMLGIFFVLGWGIPAVIILLYIIIMYALGSASLHESYGDVHSNGEMCMVMNRNGAVLSAVVPATLCILIVVTIAFHLYHKKGEWKKFDDVYYGKFNSTEIPLLYWSFFLVSITWFWGGLHLAYGYLWILILFIVCNFLQGFYVLVTYGILHCPVLNRTKDMYDEGLDNNPEKMAHENLGFQTSVIDGVVSVTGDILNKSTQSLVKMDGAWGSQDNSMNDNVIFGYDDENMNENSVDFDELIFALKGDFFTGSDRGCGSDYVCNRFHIKYLRENLGSNQFDETKPHVVDPVTQQYMTSTMLSSDSNTSGGRTRKTSFPQDRPVFPLSDTHL